MTVTVVWISCSQTVTAQTFVGQTLWSPNGEPLSTDVGSQGVSPGGRPGVSLVPDGVGGAFIAWVDLGAATIVAQHLDAAGQGLWGSVGVTVADAVGYKFSPAAISDGAGGVIVAWVDGRNGLCGPGFQAECDVFAQRFDATGNRLWGADAAAITTAPANQGTSGLALVSDGASGAIVAWEDARSTCCRIFAQRIDSGGTTAWTANGVPVSPPPTIVIGGIGAPPLAVSDGTGGAIIAYLNIQLNPVTDHPRIALQRLDANGESQWRAEGLWVGMPAYEDFGELTTDGAGGAIVAWARRVPGQVDDLVLAQRVAPTGAMLWPAEGITVASGSFARRNLDLVSDGAGGAIIVWEDERDGESGDCFRLVGNCNIYGQRLSATGQALWGVNGVPISVAANTQNSPRLTADGAGGAVVVWQDCRDYPTLDECGFGLDLYAQRVSASGTLRWTDALQVSVAPGNQGIPPGTPWHSVLAAITDGAGGAIVAWPDGRNSPCQQLVLGCDLYAQRLNERALIANYRLFWQHQSLGYIAAWNMAGPTLVSGTALSPSQVADTNWKIVGTGDFNGDGHLDLFWQHQRTRLMTIWLMNGTTFMAPGLLNNNTVSDTNWAIRAIADMNGDGKPDLIWQHEVDGWLVVWLMDGTNLVRGVFLSPNRVADTNWRIAAAADFNNDGKPDLLWQHFQTGLMTVWLMDGTTFVTPGLISNNTVADTDWKIKVVVDVDGNGRPDFIWHHRTSGLLAVWFMEGTTFLSGRLLAPDRVADIGWQIVGPR